jgi:hypothetical protein
MKGIPEVIPINREEEYHTHYIGTTGDGRQFFGYQSFVFPDGYPTSDDWTQARKEYVVLYIFDKQGNYLDTKHWYSGTTAETDDEVSTQKLEEFISELGPVTFTDITVKPFQVIIDGFVFGLVPNKKGNCVELQPGNTISFQEPWDGEYYT